MFKSHEFCHQVLFGHHCLWHSCVHRWLQRWEAYVVLVQVESGSVQRKPLVISACSHVNDCLDGLPVSYQCRLKKCSVTCNDNSHCSGLGDFTCDTISKVCRDCTSSSDCNDDEVCSMTCIKPCDNPERCEAGQTCVTTNHFTKCLLCPDGSTARFIDPRCPESKFVSLGYLFTRCLGK